MATRDSRLAGQGDRSLAELEAEITAIASCVNAVNHRWLVLIAEFDRRAGWAEAGARSCAHWLNWKCGLDLGAAQEKVRVAHALGRLPLIAAAMASGELSYSKARALTRVATAENEPELLAAARQATAHHVDAMVRQYRRSQELAEVTREARQYAKRQLVYSFDEDGSLTVRARLTAEAGAVLLRSLCAAIEEVPWSGVSAATATGAADVSAATGSEPADVAAETSVGDSNWAACLRRESRGNPRGWAGRATGRRSQDAYDPAGAATGARIPRRRVRVPWLHPQALRGRPPPAALGRRRHHEAREPRDAVPLPPPRSPRGRHARRAASRRRMALYASRRRGS